LPFGTINDNSGAISIDTFVDRARITVLTVERFKNTPDLRITTIDRAWIAIDTGIDRYMEATNARVTHVCGACVVVVTIGVRLTSARRNTLAVDANSSPGTVFVRFAAGRGHASPGDTDLSLATIIIVFAHSSFARPTIITVPEVCVRGIGADGDCMRVAGIAGGNMANGHLAVQPFLAWAICCRETSHRHTQAASVK